MLSLIILHLVKTLRPPFPPFPTLPHSATCLSPSPAICARCPCTLSNRSLFALPNSTSQRYLRAAKVSNSLAADRAALFTYLRRPFEQMHGTITQQQQQREAARAIVYIL